MNRYPLVTPAHRDHLIRLKTEFDAACALVDDFSDRTSPAFRNAQDLYQTWIKAIDASALALLSDLAMLDEGGAGRGPFGNPGGGRSSPVEPIPAGEVDHVFAELDDLAHARVMVTETEDDQDAIDLFGS